MSPITAALDTRTVYWFQFIRALREWFSSELGSTPCFTFLKTVPMFSVQYFFFACFLSRKVWGSRDLFSFCTLLSLSIQTGIIPIKEMYFLHISNYNATQKIIIHPQIFSRHALLYWIPWTGYHGTNNLRFLEAILSSWEIHALPFRVFWCLDIVSSRKTLDLILISRPHFIGSTWISS